MRTGRMFVTATGELNGPRWIINFPTKQHWRHPSQIEWIEEGLRDLVRVLATVDWLLYREGCTPDVPSLRQGLERWPGGADAGQRKLRILDDRLLKLAADRLTGADLDPSSPKP